MMTDDDNDGITMAMIRSPAVRQGRCAFLYFTILCIRAASIIAPQRFRSAADIFFSPVKFYINSLVFM